MNVARAVATATLLPNGKVLIAGGKKVQRFVQRRYCQHRAIRPGDQFFRVGFGNGEHEHGARRATATLLPNGKVLIAGGEIRPATFLPAPSYTTRRPILSRRLRERQA